MIVPCSFVKHIDEQQSSNETFMHSSIQNYFESWYIFDLRVKT